MVGRGRQRARRKRPPAAAVKQRAPMTYYQEKVNLTVNSLGLNASDVLLMVDNSVVVGNEVVNFKKLTMSWYTDLVTDSALLWAVTRETEGSSAPSLIAEATVRNLRNENHLIRGPSFMPTRPGSDDLNWRKTVVLKNITLDEDDDLRLVVTNVVSALGSSNNTIITFMKGWYRVVS